MICEEKARLVDEYSATTSDFSKAVQESSKGDYGRLERASNDARVKSEGARLALEQHIATGGEITRNASLGMLAFLLLTE
jgi:hypothetical protein